MRTLLLILLLANCANLPQEKKKPRFLPINVIEDRVEQLPANTDPKDIDFCEIFKGTFLECSDQEQAEIESDSECWDDCMVAIR